MYSASYSSVHSQCKWITSREIIPYCMGNLLTWLWMFCYCWVLIKRVAASVFFMIPSRSNILFYSFRLKAHSLLVGYDLNACIYIEYWAPMSLMTPTEPLLTFTEPQWHPLSPTNLHWAAMTPTEPQWPLLRTTDLPIIFTESQWLIMIPTYQQRPPFEINVLDVKSTHF